MDSNTSDQGLPKSCGRCDIEAEGFRVTCAVRRTAHVYAAPALTCSMICLMTLKGTGSVLSRHFWNSST